MICLNFNIILPNQYPMKLNESLEDIKNWQEFENLVRHYFEDIYIMSSNGVKTVIVQSSGEGADGGKDLLVIFKSNDSLVEYERKWVVQCKFYERSVSPSDLADTNIPGLIHQYGAEGYLLVCKKNVTSGTVRMFENWRKNCKFGYQYKIWTGSMLTRLIAKLNEE